MGHMGQLMSYNSHVWHELYGNISCQIFENFCPAISGFQGIFITIYSCYVRGRCYKPCINTIYLSQWLKDGYISISIQLFTDSWSRPHSTQHSPILGLSGYALIYHLSHNRAVYLLIALRLYALQQRNTT